MKFKFRADGDDLFIFAMFAIFLLYIVAIVVANVHSFAVDGQLSGINPLPAFPFLSPEAFVPFGCLLWSATAFSSS